MHTSVGLFSSVWMVTQGEFPPFFYLFCWLSWKVSPLWLTLYQFINILYRITLATIRYLGGCPRPCCFIRNDQISTLGTKADDQRCIAVTSVQILKTNNIKSTKHKPGYSTMGKVLIVSGWRISFKLIHGFTYWFLIECLFIQVI